MSLASFFADTAARMAISAYGESVTYTRKADGTAKTLSIYHTNPTRQEMTESGAVVVTQTESFRVLPADFRTAFGASAVPADDDRITYNSRTYRVKPRDGEDCYRLTKDGAYFLLNTIEGAA